MGRIRRAIAFGALAAALSATLGGAPPAANATCATCHSREAQEQPHSEMGIALQLPGSQDVLTAHPVLAGQANGYTYRISRKDGVSSYTVTDGSSSLTFPIQYIFGAFNQTFVLEYQGHFYESLMSYYGSTEGLGVTMGDERLKPHSLEESIGRRTSDQEITACFGCHSTGAVSQGRLDLQAMQPGLQCGHCHTGTEAHLRAMRGGQAAPVPQKLGDLAAEEMSEFCGQCHRTWQTILELRIFGPRNARFQPYRLANSRCFLGSDKRIRCTACHDPHGKLVRDEGFYDTACLQCHGQSAANAPTKKTCQVADRNCVSCHMPKVPTADGKATFTDHFIRIVSPGEAYPD